jgi:ribose 5-phosphate isomerase B
MKESSMTLTMASDHGGFAMKTFLKEKLERSGYTVLDFGTNSEESVDYPDMIHPLASAINKGEFERGIILCGSGNGAQMTANKYPNVRAGLCWDVLQAELIRRHNDANVLSLPGRFISMEEAWKITEIFLNTSFDGGRHLIRVNKINKLI